MFVRRSEDNDVESDCMGGAYVAGWEGLGIPVSEKAASS